ncbi:glycosyl hydrolase [Amylocarpus encephaloides]|uniref:Glycosyl hydrolase n=1 Tax=Amylocarpus encephaloides TaxID=45428 RepID=A0A9P8C4R1_9HELO|nr:glycosyl hydrolase [Amylocarpus encephaloides]
MRLSKIFSSFLITSVALSLPTELAATTEITTRADSSLVGYLGVFFLGNAPDIYFYLSNGNNALSFKALNKGNAILNPSLGTGGVRDPSIIAGAGAEAGKKWYIIGTDLNIAKTTWDASQRKGSLKIYIWESTDMINWGTERLVQVENNNAGMVWAPDAIWDPAKGQYLVHWASRFYSASDSSHTGSSGANQIRYAYTSDFKTFSAPQTLINASPTAIIDLSILQLGANSFARFIKNESATNVYMERSDTGLFGTWTRPGGGTTFIHSGVEGPYAYADNVTPGKVVLLLDYYGSDGYRPFTSTNLNANAWRDADRSGFPKNLRHGSVIGITKDKYDALNARWGA